MPSVWKLVLNKFFYLTKFHAVMARLAPPTFSYNSHLFYSKYIQAFNTIILVYNNYVDSRIIDNAVINVCIITCQERILCFNILFYFPSIRERTWSSYRGVHLWVPGSQIAVSICCLSQSGGCGAILHSNHHQQAKGNRLQAIRRYSRRSSHIFQ